MFCIFLCGLFIPLPTRWQLNQIPVKTKNISKVHPSIQKNPEANYIMSHDPNSLRLPKKHVMSHEAKIKNSKNMLEQQTSKKWSTRHLHKRAMLSELSHVAQDLTLPRHPFSSQTQSDPWSRSNDHPPKPATSNPWPMCHVLKPTSYKSNSDPNQRRGEF